MKVHDSPVNSSVTPKSGASARRAWLALACTPLVVVVGFFVPYWVAAVIDAPFAASPSQPLSFLQALVLFVTTAVIVVAAPGFALVSAIGPARAGSRSARAALIVSALLIVVFTVLCAATFF